MINSVCFYSLPDPSIRSYYALIDASVRHGLRQLEGFCHMELAQPDVEAAKAIRRYADAKGVSFCCFSVFSDLTGEAGDRAVERLKGFARIAAILGSPYLHHTVIPEFRDPDKVLPRRDALLEQILPRVREVFDYAQSLGVLAVYEDQGFVLNGVEGFRAFLDQVDRPVGIVADFGNILQSGETIAPFIRAFGSRIVHVHLKDYLLPDWDGNPRANRTLDGRQTIDIPLGTGCIDFAGAIGLLKSVGYRGCYAMEFSEPADGSLPTEAAIHRIQTWLT